MTEAGPYRDWIYDNHRRFHYRQNLTNSFLYAMDNRKLNLMLLNARQAFFLSRSKVDHFAAVVLTLSPSFAACHFDHTTDFVLTSGTRIFIVVNFNSRSREMAKNASECNRQGFLRRFSRRSSHVLNLCKNNRGRLFLFVFAGQTRDYALPCCKRDLNCNMICNCLHLRVKLQFNSIWDVISVEW